MKAALYARVSTDNKGQTPDNQLEDLRRFAETQGWQIVAEFADYESGSKANRPQFQAMLSAASRHEFDVLVFWALDRLTREGALKTLEVLNQLAHWGVDYRSYTESYIDSAGPFGEAIIALLATIAKQERLRLQERVKAGLARARREGRRLGRPAKVIDRYRVVELRRRGLSWRRIGVELGITSAAARRAYSAARGHLAEMPVGEGT